MHCGSMGGVLLGTGGFQLYDGTVQHKLMQIHQIRYVEDVFVYDLIWNISAVLIIIIGLSLVVPYTKQKTTGKGCPI